MYTYVCGVAVILPDGRITVSVVAIGADSAEDVKRQVLDAIFSELGPNVQIVISDPQTIYDLMRTSGDIQFSIGGSYA